MPLNQSYVESRPGAGTELAPKAVMLFDDMVHWLDSIAQLNGTYNPEIAVCLADATKFIEENLDLPYMTLFYTGLYADVQALGKVTGGALVTGSRLWHYPDATTLGTVSMASGSVVKGIKTFEIRPAGVDTGRWLELRKLAPELWPQVRRHVQQLPDDSVTTARPSYFWPVTPYTVQFESPANVDYDTRVGLVVFTDPFPEGVQSFTPAGFHPMFNEFRNLCTAESIKRLAPIVRDAQVIQFWLGQAEAEWRALHTRLESHREAEVQLPVGFLNWEGSVDV